MEWYWPTFSQWGVGLPKKLKTFTFLICFVLFGPFWALWAPGSVKNVPGVVFGAECTIFRHIWWTLRCPLQGRFGAYLDLLAFIVAYCYLLLLIVYLQLWGASQYSDGGAVFLFE